MARRTMRADVLDEGSQTRFGSGLSYVAASLLQGRKHHRVDDAWLSTLASLPPFSFRREATPCEQMSYMYHNLQKWLVDLRSPALLESGCRGEDRRADSGDGEG